MRALKACFLICVAVLGASAQSPVAVTLASAATPAAGEPGVTVVNLTGSNFPAGAIAPAAVTVTLAPASGPSVATAATAVTSVVGTTRRVAFTIPASIRVSSPTVYSVTVAGATTTGTAFASSNAASLTVNPAAGLLSVDPATGLPGQTLSVLITGQFTNWVQGVTQASFGAGISVTGLAVTSPTSASASIAIDPTAIPGARTVTVSTGAEIVTHANGFTVIGVPVLNTINPSSGQQGQTAEPVALTGQYTHWVQGTSTASFGAGVTVTSFTVSSATTATAILTIDPAATVGNRTVTVSTGGEVLTLANGFTVNPGNPVLTTIAPNTGPPGATAESIALTGQYTHWIQGTSTASFGAGVTVTSLTVNSPTSATAVISIDPSATTGTRAVTVSTGTEIVALANGFTVVGTPVLTTVNPSSGQQGQTAESIALTGQYTHWVQGTSTASFGAGVTVTSLTVNSPTSATAVISIDPSATTGTRAVTVSTGTEIIALANGFTVVGTPVLTTVNPSSGQQGQTAESIALTGQYTHWIQGTSTASFGAGVTVTSLTVNSPTSATAVISIDPSATTGTRAVTVSTGTEIIALANGFTVVGTPVLTTVNPSSGQQGQTAESIALTGQYTHWIQGTSTASFGAGVTVTSLTVNSPTSATAVISIDPSATTGTRAVTVSTGTEIVALANGFTVVGAPVLTTVNPSSGQQGQTAESVALTGQYTHWVQGSSTASFGAGVTVTSLTVNSPTSATAILTIDPAASLGTRAVTVTTGGEIVTLANAFTVGNGAPALITVNPNSGQQGITNLNVTLAGQYTHWVQGTTTASFGAGVTVTSLTVNSPTTATAIIAIDPAATTGSRTVTVTTGGEMVTLANAFNVNPGTPVITLINPNSGQQGQTAESVSLTGQYTHWVQGTSTATFGAGITITSLTVSSPTTAAAVISIDPTAATGTRTVTVTTGSELAGLANVFNVTNGTPALTTVAPATGSQAQTNLSVVLTGQYTHWLQGTSTATFGAGITVTSLTVSSPTSATALISIDPAATLGARTVAVTTGAELAGLNGGFTVVSGNPILTSVAPNIGQQGQTAESVTLTGQYTHWLQGTSNASFGAGITVTSFTVSSPTSVTALLTIDPAATLGFRTVTVTTGTEIVTLANGFTVNNGSPILTTISPNNGQQGQTAESITLTGQYTHWTQGTTTATFGTGVTVTSLTVSSPTTASAVLAIDPATTTGPRTITVTTGTEIVSLANAFTVNPGTPVINTVAPNTGQQAQIAESVALTGQYTHWVQGTSTASFGAGVTVTSLAVNSSTTATALISIDPTATLGTRTVTVTTGSETASLANGFTVTVGSPVISTVNPNTGIQGQTAESVALTGLFTHWVQGTSTASFGAGVTVTSFTVTSLTNATAVISIDPAAAASARTVTVTTGSEVASLAGAFTVAVGNLPPVITSLTPDGGITGASITLNVAGNYFTSPTTFSTSPAGGLTYSPTTTFTSATGAATITGTPGLYAVVASNAGGNSGSTLTPNNRFIVLETSGEGDSFLITILNTAAPPAGTPDPTAVSNEASGKAVSVLNIKAPPAGTADPTAVSNEAASNTVTVFNISDPNAGGTDPTAVSNESTGKVITVLNIKAPPAGTADPTAVSNEASSKTVAVLNTQPPPAGTADPTVVSNESDSAVATVYNSSSPSAHPTAALSAAIAPIPPPATPGLRLTGLDDPSRLVAGATATLTADLPRNFSGSAIFSVNGVLFESVSAPPFSTTFTVPAGIDSLNFSVELRDAAGTYSTAPPLRIPVVSDPRTEVAGRIFDSVGHPVEGHRVTLEAQGLLAEYFHFDDPLTAIPDLSDTKPAKTTLVPGLNLKNPQHVFGPDPLGLSLSPDYAARYRGEIQIGQGGGKYTFFLKAHKGARLTIDGAQLVETTAADLEFAESAAELTLGPGWHKIEVVYFEAVGAPWLDLTWAPPGAPRQPIPALNLRARDERKTATTDAAGEFRILDVPANLDQLQVSAESSGAAGPVTSAPAKPLPASITRVGDITIEKF